MSRTRTSATIAALGLTILMLACGGGSPSPASPTPQAATATSGALSGVVFEITAGTFVGVEGVEVYCDTCGPIGHSHRFTDGTGEYDFGEVANGHPLLVLGPNQDTTWLDLKSHRRELAGWAAYAPQSEATRDSTSN